MTSMDKFVYTDEMKAYDEERAVAEAEGRMAPGGIDWEGYWMNQQQQMKFEEEVRGQVSGIQGTGKEIEQLKSLDE